MWNTWTNWKQSLSHFVLLSLSIYLCCRKKHKKKKNAEDMGFLLLFQLFLLAFLSGGAQHTHAWGPEGHYMICKIAQVCFFSLKRRKTLKYFETFSVNKPEVVINLYAILKFYFYFYAVIVEGESITGSYGPSPWGSRRRAWIRLFMGWWSTIPKALSMVLLSTFCQYARCLWL